MGKMWQLLVEGPEADHGAPDPDRCVLYLGCEDVAHILASELRDDHMRVTVNEFELTDERKAAIASRQESSSEKEFAEWILATYGNVVNAKVRAKAKQDVA